MNSKHIFQNLFIVQEWKILLWLQIKKIALHKLFHVKVATMSQSAAVNWIS